MPRRGLPAVLALTLWLAAAVVWAQDGITVRIDPETAESTLSVTLPAGRSDGTRSLLLRNTTDAVVAVTGLEAFLEDTGGQPLSGASARVLDAAGTPLGSLQLKTGEERRILLELEGLPRSGTAKGWLILDYGGRERFHRLTVSHASPATLKVVGAEDAKIAREVGPQPFVIHLTIENPADQPAVEDLTVNLGPLSRADGQPLRGATLGCSPCGEKTPQRLAAGEVLDLTLRGDRFERTAYRSTLLLGYQGRTQPLEVTLTRGAPTAQLEIQAPAAVAVQRWNLFGARAWVDFTVRETGGLTATLHPPALGSVRREGEAAAESFGNAAMRVLYRDDRGRWRGLESPPEAGKPDPLVLPDGDQRDFAVVVTGLAPGTYAGEIAVSGPDSARVTQKVTLSVKDNALAAFVVIFLGVALSFGIHFWRRVLRQRYQLNTAIARERERIRRLFPGSDPVAVFLLRELEVLLDDNQGGMKTKPVVTILLDEVKSRRVHHGEGKELCRQIKRLLATYPTEPPELGKKKGAFLHRSDTLAGDLGRELLRPPLPETGAEATAAAEARKGLLEELRKLLAELQKSAVEAPARLLAEDLEKLSQEVSAAALTDLAADAADQARRIKEEILPSFDNADRPLESLADDVRAARREYAELRRRQLVEIAAQLRGERRAAPRARQTDWQPQEERLEAVSQAADRSRRAATADDALREWKEGRRQLLRARIEHLAVLAGPQGGPPEVTEDEWAQACEKHPQVRREVDEALRRWQTGDLEGAEDRHDKAWEEYTDLLFVLLDHRVERFVEKLEAGELMPCFLTSDDELEQIADLDLFTELKQQIKRAREAGGSVDERLAAYRRLRADLAERRFAVLEELAKWLRKASQIESGKEKEKAWKKILPDKLKPLEVELAKARSALEEVRQGKPGEAARERLLEAEQAVAGAVVKAQVMIKILRTSVTGVVMSAEDEKSFQAQILTEGTAPAPGSPVGLPAATGPEAPDPDIVPPPPPRGEPLSSRQWLKRLQWGNWLVSAVVLVVAAATGLMALWATDATFGGADYVTAFLWGFGFHEASTGFLQIAAGTGILPAETQG